MHHIAPPPPSTTSRTARRELEAFMSRGMTRQAAFQRLREARPDLLVALVAARNGCSTDYARGMMSQPPQSAPVSTQQTRWGY